MRTARVLQASGTKHLLPGQGTVRAAYEIETFAFGVRAKLLSTRSRAQTAAAFNIPFKYKRFDVNNFSISRHFRFSVPIFPLGKRLYRLKTYARRDA